MSSPVKVVVDCSNVGAPDPALSQRIREEALALLEKAATATDEGRRVEYTQMAANVMRQSADAAAAASLAVEEVVPLTDEELRQVDVDAAAALATARQNARDRIIAALNDTDKWAARAVEEGVAMAAVRVKYRQTLRTLLGSVDQAENQAALDAITVPAPPTPPDA